MNEEIELKSFPFDSIAKDREYPANIFRNYFYKFLSTGVYFGKYKNYGDYSMKVVPDTGLKVKVTKGAGNIKGLDFELDEDTLLNINLSAETNRKDLVIVKADDTLARRKTTLYVKEGTATEFPTLTRTNDIYELGIAKINVTAGKITIDLDDIEDTRRNEDLCGIVTSLIDIDIQDVLDDITAKKNNYFAVLSSLTQTEIDELIAGLKQYIKTAQTALEGDVAMNLLNLITANTTSINNLQTTINTKANKKKVWNITIDNEWEGTEAPYTKTVNIEGIQATDEPHIILLFSGNVENMLNEEKNFSKIRKVDSADGSLTFMCFEEKPEISLNLRVEVFY